MVANKYGWSRVTRAAEIPPSVFYVFIFSPFLMFILATIYMQNHTLTSSVIYPKTLTQDVSKCEKILELRKIDFLRLLTIGQSSKMMKNGG